nr:sodium-coupled monocarboxylate transporter 2-like [Lytechinus pictus]
MKAVLWTDVFQVTLMVIGFIAVIIQGAINVGGLDKAWHIAAIGQRLDMWVWSTDVTVRHTIWGIVIGGGFNWTSVFGVNQAQVQRYLTCGSIQRAKVAILIATFGMIAVQLLPHIVGVVMYANYAGCDPKLHGVVESYDQMMPYFIMDLFGSMPGLPGLLTSAVFSAALSTISSGLNALAAVAGEDIVKSIWPDITDKRYTWVTKGLAIVFGVISMCSALLASQMGAILQFSMNIFGMFGGPVLGLFSCGMFFPWINAKGVTLGTITGLAYSCWLAIGVQMYPNPPDDPPLTTDQCPMSNTTTDLMMNTSYFSTLDSTTPVFDNLTMVVPNESALVNFYKLSYTWYGISSWLVVLFVANIVSFITGPQDPKKLDPRLICPIVDKMYCCLPEKWKIPLRCRVGEEYKDYEYQAMETKNNVIHVEPKRKVEYDGEDSEL